MSGPVSISALFIVTKMVTTIFTITITVTTMPNSLVVECYYCYCCNIDVDPGLYAKKVQYYFTSLLHCPRYVYITQ